MNNCWIIQLKFNGIERLFHQYRVQNQLINLPPSLKARISEQHVAMVDHFVLEFELSVYDDLQPESLDPDQREYLLETKKYFCNKCSNLNQLISCYAANLTDNEVQIYFYRKVIRLLDDLMKVRRSVGEEQKDEVFDSVK